MIKGRNKNLRKRPEVDIGEFFLLKLNYESLPPAFRLKILKRSVIIKNQGQMDAACSPQVTQKFFGL